MKNLPLWQKLTLLFAVFLLPLAAVTFVMISSVHSLGITVAQKELLGVQLIRPVLTLLRDLQCWRGLAAAHISGSAELRDDLAKTRAAVEHDLAALDAAHADLRSRLSLGNQGPALIADCRALLAGGSEDATRQTAIIEQALTFLRHIADQSELTLDPEMRSYYLMDLFCIKIPQHAEQVGRAWAGIAAVLPRQKLTPAALIALQRTAGLIERLDEETARSLAKAADGDPALAARLARTNPTTADPLVETLTTGVAPASPAEIARTMTARLDADYIMAAHTDDEIITALNTRLAKLNRRINRSLAFGAGGLLLISWLGWVILQDIRRPLCALAETARAIEANNTDAQVTVGEREDEIGELAHALTRMIAADRQARSQLIENNLAMLTANEKLIAKSLEAQRLAVEADSANRAKRDFLAVMSHEIRTPMNGIIGMTELALNTELNDSQREYLGMVKSSAESLLELLNDILDFSKIEAGRLELEHTDFDLRDTLGDTMQTLAMRAHAKNLELALQIRPDVPDALIGDPHRLRQIIVNLVGNALKFTDRGEVTVLVENGGVENGQALVRFAVRDTGIGIASAARERIFDAFSQADVSTTRRFGGTGLGLAITSQLVDLMGGRIELESEDGKGSTFRFTARFGVQAVAPAHEPPELENLRVLAVDDNATNRLILRELFTSWHMQVVVAESAAEGLAALDAATHAGEPIALLVTDMMMPDLDGFGLVERVRANPALHETRVIMLTSSNRPEDIARCRELGIGAHLAKPIKQSMLMDTIVDVLGSGRRQKRRMISDSEPVPLQRSLRILLAEDNAVNQRLAVVNLESWGHQVTVANNGAEAVEAFASGHFDAILMDSQMPKMGGFEATAEIRRRERATGAHIPIIAMTANVMKGSREECLAAGMDGYVAKPMRRPELIAALAEAVPDFLLAENHTPARPPAAVSNDAPFDAAALLESLGGDRALLREMVQLCLTQDAPRLLADLRAGLAASDLAAIAQAAHGLKGLVGEFHAPAVYAAARQLEETARAPKPADLTAHTETFQREFARFAEALEKHAAAAR